MVHRGAELKDRDSVPMSVRLLALGRGWGWTLIAFAPSGTKGPRLHLQVLECYENTLANSPWRTALAEENSSPQNHTSFQRWLTANN